MDIATIQQFLRDDQAQAAYPFRSPAEILVTLTEELGEVIKEVSLFERIGTKAGWEKAPSQADLTEEMIHLLNSLCWRIIIRLTWRKRTQIILIEHGWSNGKDNALSADSGNGLSGF